MDAAFVGGLIVGAFVFTPLGMMVMGRLCANSRAMDEQAVENRLLRAYMDGFRNARLQAAAESHGFAERAEALAGRGLEYVASSDMEVGR